jgi:predicted nucleic acid-binding protein
MTDRCFVDTNVLVYAHDGHAGQKHVAAASLVERLWEERAGVLSTQVLQELYVSLRKSSRRPLPRGQAQEIVSDYLRWNVIVNTGSSLLAAMKLEERYRLSFWDALIVQAATAAGVATLFSEDLSHGQAYGPVRVVNPFRG